jgi:hypothetical protein
MIWTSEDCHMIEFNEYLDSQRWNAQQAVSLPLRSMYFAGFWTKTGTGEYWIVEPSKKHASDFYQSNMLVSVKEVLKVLNQMELIQPDWNIDQYPTEEHSVWNDNDNINAL